jgi:uncharacterized protein
MEALCRLSYSGGSRDDSNGPRPAWDDAVVRRLRTVLLLSVLIGACDRAPDVDSFHEAVGRIEFGPDARLRVRIADRPGERARGLMGVPSLSADEGMAFVFGDEPVSDTFWMKDTEIPLSIAFVLGTRVVDVVEMTPCRDDPCRMYRSDSPYTLAIEASAGWFRRHGVGPGDEMTSFDGSFFE